MAPETLPVTPKPPMQISFTLFSNSIALCRRGPDCPPLSGASLGSLRDEEAGADGWLARLAASSPTHTRDRRAGSTQTRLFQCHLPWHPASRLVLRLTKPLASVRPACLHRHACPGPGSGLPAS